MSLSIRSSLAKLLLKSIAIAFHVPQCLGFVDAARDGAREQSAAMCPSRMTLARRGSASCCFAVATAKTMSPSNGVCTGRRARAKPSAAMIAMRFELDAA